MKLVIIESPGKIKSLNKILGSEYEVMATFGHCVDLPKNGLSVDIKNDFTPTFEIISDKKDVINSLISKSKKAKEIYIATDGDREGASIGKHVYDQIKGHTSAKIKRITYTQITKDAVLKSIQNAREMEADEELFQSQLARRILDRLCGYRTSFLVKQSTGGSSAGRVQSVALRILADRENEIKNFIAEEYWEIKAHLLSPKNEAFECILSDKTKIKNEVEAKTIYEKVRVGTPVVKSVESKLVETKPSPPFVTQAMVAAAKNSFGWSNSKTMQIAQELYEDGLISYMRTDSYYMDEESIAASRNYIQNNVGKEYLPSSVNFYKNKASAQAGHCACHPTDLSLTTAKTGDHQKLYEMIWRRTIASQMVPCKENRIKAIIDISKYDFISNGNTTVFDGFKKIWNYSTMEEKYIPFLKKDDICKFDLQSKE